MSQNDLGYYQEPKNGSGIVRARTSLQIRSWELPKTEKALDRFNKDIEGAEFPGVYVLFEKEHKAYVGEAKSLYDRVKTHISTPDEKIKNWDKSLLISDGRPATQSLFNDTVIRLAIEHHVKELLRSNKMVVVSQAEPQKLTPSQAQTVEGLRHELGIFLMKKGIIAKLPEKPGQEQIFADELKKILAKSGKKISKWTAVEIEFDDQKAFVRPGSSKAKGWQITFRDLFKNALQNGEGYLLVPRDGVLLIPLKEVLGVVKDQSAFAQNTIDVYVVFTPENVTLTYKDATVDVSQYRLTDSF